MWTDKYVGIPYVDGGRAMDGVDCLGLLVMVFKERHNIAFPDPQCNAPEALRRGEAETQKKRFRCVQVAEEGDVVLVRVKGRPLHIGYALNHFAMLHADHALGVCVEDFTAPRWSARVEGIYRIV